MSNVPQIETELRRKRLSYPGLPLAVYREIAAHLQQISETQVELISATDLPFAYLNSQIEAVVITYDPNQENRIGEILRYYAQKYGHDPSVP